MVPEGCHVMHNSLAPSQSESIKILFGLKLKVGNLTTGKRRLNIVGKRKEITRQKKYLEAIHVIPA